MKRTLARMFGLFATVTLTFGLVLGACATAGGDDDDDGTPSVDATAPRPDASVSPWPDARPPADARPPNMFVDANVSIADAGISVGDGGGLFCTDSSMCTEAGTCCFSLGGPGFCVPGTEIGGVCFPTE